MSTNRTHFIVDAQQFEYTQDTLFTWESIKVLAHEQSSSEGEFIPLVQWNEDGLFVVFSFSLDNTKSVSLLSMALALVATDGVNSFELDRINLNLIPNLSTTPVLSVDTTRGYVLNVGDQFNFVKIATGSPVGDKQFYSGQIGQKITWQEWIANANVPAVFLDLAQQNDGLNQKADNYSNLNGYDIKVRLIAEVNGDDSTQGNINQEQAIDSNPIYTFNYNESDDGTIASATIETFDATGTTNLGGAILPDASTLFRTTWVGAAALNASNVTYIIHRIEQEFSLGNLAIEESSTLQGAVTGGILGAVSVSQSGSDIVSECLISPNLSGRYKLSSRIKMNFEPFVNSQLANSGFEVVRDLVRDLNPLGGIFVVDCKPLGQEDKFEIIHNGVKVATTSMLSVNNGGSFDPANDNSNYSDTRWFIGTALGTVPTFITEFQDATGLTTPITGTGFGLYPATAFQQRIWWVYTAADYATASTCTIRITGLASTGFDLITVGTT